MCLVKIWFRRYSRYFLDLVLEVFYQAEQLIDPRTLTLRPVIVKTASYSGRSVHVHFGREFSLTPCVISSHSFSLHGQLRRSSFAPIDKLFEVDQNSRQMGDYLSIMVMTLTWRVTED